MAGRDIDGVIIYPCTSYSHLTFWFEISILESEIFYCG